MTHWLLGAFGVLFGLLGAILASRALDTGMLTFGLLLVGFAVIFVFWMIKDSFDERERSSG